MCTSPLIASVSFPPAKKKPKKGEEVYSDEDQEEKNDQPEGEVEVVESRATD